MQNLDNKLVRLRDTDRTINLQKQFVSGVNLRLVARLIFSRCAQQISKLVAMGVAYFAARVATMMRWSNTSS